MKDHAAAVNSHISIVILNLIGSEKDFSDCKHGHSCNSELYCKPKNIKFHDGCYLRIRDGCSNLASFHLRIQGT